MMLTLEAIIQAQQRIAPYIRHTPLAPTPYLTETLPNRLRLKLENLQVTGSFKVRGALNNLLCASETERKRGIVVASGGNHGVAIAYAAAKLGAPATVVLPTTASPDRVARIQSWGANVLSYGLNPSDAILKAEEMAGQQGLLYVHPFEAERTWEGTGTVGLEIIRDLPEVDCALIAIGGGGLISGVATALRAHNPKVRIIGVEPCGAASMATAVRSGGLVELLDVRTIADTLAPRVAGVNTYPAALRLVDQIALVTDAMMVEAMRYLWREYNQLAEPAGVAVLAAILAGIVDLQPFKAPVAVICGGNASVNTAIESYAERANKSEPTAPGLLEIKSKNFTPL